MKWTMKNNDTIITGNDLEPLDNSVVMDFCAPITKCSKNMQRQINIAISESKEKSDPDKWCKAGPAGIVVDYLALGIELDNINGLKFYIGMAFHDAENENLVADVRIDVSLNDKEYIREIVHQRIDDLLF